MCAHCGAAIEATSDPGGPTYWRLVGEGEPRVMQPPFLHYPTPLQSVEPLNAEQERIYDRLMEGARPVEPSVEEARRALIEFFGGMWDDENEQVAAFERAIRRSVEAKAVTHLRAVSTVHVHRAACYSNHNDPTRPYCGDIEPDTSYLVNYVKAALNRMGLSEQEGEGAK